jgi:tRNA-dihydrouridine synthase
MNMTYTIFSSPLQGITDFRFRNTYQKYFGGIAAYYAPYIRLQGPLEIKASEKRDILPENNKGTALVPQVMTNDADEFLFVANEVKKLGYNELNWNLGCPYPMVTNRNLGAGLLNDPKRISEILKKVNAKSDITVSVKMRLGNINPDEIFKVLPVLESLSLKHIIIHPRTARQMYKDDVNLSAFKRCTESTSHTIVYNGDITTVKGFQEISARVPSVTNWMIGRGMVSDPFLPDMIMQNTCTYPADRTNTFKKFHDSLFDEYEKALSGESHLLMKMWTLWEYFATAFTNPHKGLKKIKKAKSIDAYHAGVMEVLNAEK